MSSKKSKSSCLEEEFAEWQEDACCNNSCEKDETDEYVAASFDSQMLIDECVVNNEFQILKFWNSATVRSAFPTLSRIALGLLSVPASSASSERAFSTSGIILEKRSLSGSAVNALMVLNGIHKNK